MGVAEVSEGEISGDIVDAMLAGTDGAYEDGYIEMLKAFLTIEV